MKQKPQTLTYASIQKFLEENHCSVQAHYINPGANFDGKNLVFFTNREKYAQNNIRPRLTEQTYNLNNNERVKNLGNKSKDTLFRLDIKNHTIGLALDNPESEIYKNAKKDYETRNLELYKNLSFEEFANTYVATAEVFVSDRFILPTVPEAEPQTTRNWVQNLDQNWQDFQKGYVLDLKK